MDAHRKIQNAIYQKTGQVLADYVLDPMPPVNSPDIANWSYTHQASHTEFTQILNIQGSDLSDIDFTKQDQVDSWLRLHFFEHQQAQLKLGSPD